MRESRAARRAAEKIDNADDFSCLVLYDSGVNGYLLCEEYGSLFQPDDPKYLVRWLEAMIPEEDQQEWRVLALLIFAEILESEGR